MADESRVPDAPADRDVYFDKPGVASVKWDRAGSTVLVEWQGWANSIEFAALLEAGVRAMEQHGGSRWLADCRRQKVLNPADQDRADREWLPRATEAGLKRFAVVLPNSGLAASNIKDRQGTLKERMEVGYFDTSRKPGPG